MAKFSGVNKQGQEFNFEAENADVALTNEQLASSSGIKELKPSTNALTSNDLDVGDDINLTQPKSDTATTSMLGEFESATDTFTKNLEEQTKRSQADEKKSFEGLMKKSFDLETPTELTARAEKEVGLSKINDELRNINDQIRNEQQALRRKVEKIQTEAGLTKGQVNQRVDEEERVSLRKQADLSVIQQAVQGKYKDAKAIADRAVDIETERNQRELAILELNYKRHKSLFDTSEQRLFESRLADRERDIKNEEENKSNIYNIGLIVGQNGGGSQLLQQIFNAKTPEEAVVLGGKFLTNPLDKKLKELQVKDKELEIAQYNTANEVLKDDKWSSVIQGTAGLVGSERGGEIRKNMANNIAKGNYKSAWADITNAVEEKLTGENATKFGASTTDYEVMRGLRNKIQDFSDGGGNLGLLNGKPEEISRRLLGITGDPKLTELAVELEREFQSYRSSMTGAAFSKEESRDYAKVNPRTTASLDLNLATIDGVLNQLEGRILGNVTARVPDARILWDITTGKSTNQYLNDVDSALKESNDPLSMWLNSL